VAADVRIAADGVLMPAGGSLLVWYWLLVCYWLLEYYWLLTRLLAARISLTSLTPSPQKGQKKTLDRFFVYGIT
jgi:hypothetical protein